MRRSATEERARRACTIVPRSATGTAVYAAKTAESQESGTGRNFWVAT
jgi:hypothetical protein